MPADIVELPRTNSGERETDTAYLPSVQAAVEENSFTWSGRRNENEPLEIQFRGALDGPRTSRCFHAFSDA